MDVRILGPFDVRADGRGLDLGGPRPRALLAVLLLCPGEVVPTDTPGRPPLGRGAAEERPPSPPRLRLQPAQGARAGVFAFGARSTTRTPGYVLELEPDALDAGIASSGCSVRDGASLRSATPTRRVGRATGGARPLARPWPSPTSPTSRSPRRRSPASKSCASSRARSGSRRISRAAATFEPVGELEAVAADNHIRQVGGGPTALAALHRSGRQAEALESYRPAFRQMPVSRNSGIEPGNRSRRLEQAMLRQDPTLELEARDRARGAAAPRYAGQSSSPCSSRASSETRELDRLDPEARRSRIADVVEKARSSCSPDTAPRSSDPRTNG